jgi:hypothetical protein
MWIACLFCGQGAWLTQSKLLITFMLAVKFRNNGSQIRGLKLNTSLVLFWATNIVLYCVATWKGSTYFYFPSLINLPHSTLLSNVVCDEQMFCCIPIKTPTIVVGISTQILVYVNWRCGNISMMIASLFIFWPWPSRLLINLTPLVRWLQKSANSISWTFQPMLPRCSTNFMNLLNLLIIIWNRLDMWHTSISW